MNSKWDKINKDILNSPWNEQILCKNKKHWTQNENASMKQNKKMPSIFDEDVVRMMGIMMFGIGFIESTLRWLKFCKIFLHTYLERRAWGNLIRNRILWKDNTNLTFKWRNA